MPCDVPREDLSAYIDDELTAERKAEIETHLLECDECSAELAFLLSGNRSVESLVEYGTPRSFETELRDRVLTYRPTRLRLWSLGGAGRETARCRGPLRSVWDRAAGRCPMVASIGRSAAA